LTLVTGGRQSYKRARVFAIQQVAHGFSALLIEFFIAAGLRGIRGIRDGISAHLIVEMIAVAYEVSSAIEW
jgi:hypothetical protein